MKPDEILAHPVTRHVARLSKLDIENLSEAEKNLLVYDVAQLIGVSRIQFIPNEKKVLKGIRDIRKRLEQAETVAEALPPELKPIISNKLPAGRSIAACIRDLRDALAPALETAEKMTILQRKNLPRRGGANYAAQAIANSAVEIFDRRVGTPTTGQSKEKLYTSRPVGERYTSNYLNFLDHILWEFGHRGACLSFGNKAASWFNKNRKNNSNLVNAD